MRIGIDARFLTHPQCGGFKSYTRLVIFALAETDVENEYVLYTDRPADPPADLPASFTLRPVTCGNGVLREQALMPSAMKSDGIDLAHFPCNTAPLHGGTRTVVTVHDAIPLRDVGRKPPNLKSRLLRSYWRAVIPGSARRAALVVTSTEYSRDDLCATLGIAREKIRVVPLAVDPLYTGLARRIPPAELDPRAHFILAFASTDGRKNHTAAIEAYRTAGLAASGVKLALVCSHPGVRPSIEQSAPDGVVPLGPVAVEELLWLYGNALALVFPSLDEGFGLPPLEAMTCGTPVVASNAGPMPEVLGDCAVYADPADPADLAKGLRLILEDESLRADLAHKGRKHAARFNRETMGRALAAVYREAASLRG